MIICLAWGSLVWRPEQLRTRGGWRNDGPDVAVEYLRQSKNGQLTLVIDQEGKRQPVLWSEMDFQDTEDAIENLRVREGKIPKEFVGIWRESESSPPEIPGLDSWAKPKGAEAVLWTALPPKFDGENHRRATIDQIIYYLENLDSKTKALAEEYVRKTPPQIRTPFRSELENKFGWSYIPDREPEKEIT